MYKTDLAFILNPPASDAEQLATASLLWMMEAGNTTSSACSPVHKPAVIVEPSASPDKTIDRRMQMHSIMSMSSEDEKESSSSDQENATKPSICSSKDCGRAAVSRGRCVRHGGGSRCTFPDCTHGARLYNRCFHHGGCKLCKIEGCTSKAKRYGYCWSHGGGHICDFPQCTKVAAPGGFCWAHGGGNRCRTEGCNRRSYQKNNYLCKQHAEKTQ